MIRNLSEKAVKILRWSEKYAKTDMVYFFKGNFWINVNRGLSVANGIALSIAFAHLLTKEAYGTYTYVFAIAGLFSMPMTTGIGAGISKGVSRGHDRMVFDGMRRILPWSIAGGVGLFGLGAYYLISGNLVLGYSFMLSGALLPVLVSVGAAKSYLSAKGDFKLATTFNSWRTPLMTLVLIFVAWKTSSAFAIILASMIGNIALSIFFYCEVKRRYAGDLEKPTTEPFAGRYAFHSALLSIFAYLSEQLDDILLWRFVGAAPVATYTYAIAPVRELRSLVENQGTIAAPRFAQKEFSEVRAGLLFRIKQLYLIAVPLIVIYILLAPFIFKFLFPRYIDAVALSQLASLSLLSAPRKLMTTAITAHQKIKESYITSILPSAVRIVIACALVPLWGIKGAVIALLASEAIDYAVLGVLMRSSDRGASQQP